MAIPNCCPLCEANETNQSVITPHVYGDFDKSHAFFKCHCCGVIYLFPQLTHDQEKRFYAQEFEKFMDQRSGSEAGWLGPESHIQANQDQFSRRWQYLEAYLPSPGAKILELGCSSGFMLLPLIQKGYNCCGIEPSGCFSSFLRDKGVNLVDEDEFIEDEFDVVMHFFVLEHVRNPIQFILNNLKMLKKKGRLIIEIPNAKDPLYTLYNIPEFEKFYWSIAHHWYFDEQSAHHLMSQIPDISYKIILDQRYDLSNHMVWARDGKPGGMARFSDKLGSRLDDEYKSNLIKNGLCDTLIIAIEKQ